MTTFHDDFDDLVAFADGLQNWRESDGPKGEQRPIPQRCDRSGRLLRCAFMHIL